MAGPGADLIVEKVACGAGLEPPPPIRLRPLIDRKAGALGRLAASVGTAAHVESPLDLRRPERGPPAGARRRLVLIQVLSKLVDHRCVVLSGRARLGAGVETRRGLDRTMAENLSDDLVLARPLVEEDLRAGVAEEVRIDREAGESKACGFDLRAESLRRFRSAPFSRKQSVGRSAQEVRAVFPDVPADDLDHLRRKLEVDRLAILGVALGDDEVDPLAACDQILAHVNLGKIADPEGHHLQDRDRRRHLSHDRLALWRARVLLDLAPDAPRQAEKQRDCLRVVERAKPLSILCGQPSPPGRQTRGDLLHLEQSQIVGLRPMSGDALEEGGDLGDLGRRLTVMAIEQEPQDQLEALEG